MIDIRPQHHTLCTARGVHNSTLILELVSPPHQSQLNYLHIRGKCRDLEKSDLWL